MINEQKHEPSEKQLEEFHEKLTKIGFEIVLESDGDDDSWMDEVIGDKFEYTCPSCGEPHVLLRITSTFTCSHCHYKVKWSQTRKWKKWKKELGEL